MRILFVRHGEPDYARDCLTDEGLRQAEAAAERLAGEGISRVYASPMGRASQTAACTAKRLGLAVEVLDFMHEITWGGPGLPMAGHPWTLSDWMIDREDFDFHAADWRAHPYFRDNAALRDYDRVTAAFDGLLAEWGWQRAGTRYRCVGGGEETVAVFSHGGSGGCVLAHLLSLPLPWVLSVMPFDFTSVIALDFPARQGECVHPRLELFNDCRHIRVAPSHPALQQRPDGEDG